VKLKIIMTGCLSSLNLFVGNSLSYASEEIGCKVEFQNNSSVSFAIEDSLDQCLLKLKGKNVDTAIIIGSASSSGSIIRNQKLAKERAATVGRVIKSKFPDASIKEISIGASKENGRKIEINFLVRDDTDKQKISELSQTLENLQATTQKERLEWEKREEEQRIASLNDKLIQESIHEKEENSFFYGNPNFRVAVSSGMNTIMKDSQRSYLAIGGEFAWINRNTLFRPEIGAKLTSSIDGVAINNQEVTRVINAFGFLGAGIGFKGFVTGARVLLGHEWINIDSDTNKVNGFATGGEARLGYECKKGFSIFASYGRTPRIQMISIDAGLSI